MAEKPVSLAGGLAFLGRHHLLIQPDAGSYFFIASILTSLPLEADKVADQPLKPTCQSCLKCSQICPTKAIQGRFFLADRCSAYLTVEHKGPIPVKLRRKLGNQLLGCDLCQQVCPHNQRLKAGLMPRFLKTSSFLVGLNLRRVLLIKTVEQFSQIFKGTAFMRAGWQNIIRNACYITANQNRHGLVPVLKEWRDHDDSVISQAAGWAIKEILG